MVKKAKDYVDYANQIQVTSGFGYNTAIAKSKETQALWSKTLDNLSDSLMKGAVAVESAKQKRLSEQLEFYVTYSPGLLFVVLPIIAARPCFERKLNWAGTIGIVFTIILTGIISYRFI